MRHKICDTCGTFIEVNRTVKSCPVCSTSLGLKSSKAQAEYSPLYVCWLSIQRRCFDVLHADYPHYGGRGITVCDRWVDSFSAFERDMGERPPGHSIERKDNDGNYEPDNCVWATMQTQSRNRRSNVRITLNGRTQILTDWCKEFAIEFSTVSERIKRGWSPSEALTTPVGKYTLRDLRKLQRLKKSSPAREVA